MYDFACPARVDAAVIDHAGIGTDSDLEPNVQRTYANAIWKGETRGFFPAVAEEMLKAGFTPAAEPKARRVRDRAYVRSTRQMYPCAGLTFSCQPG